MQTSVNKSTQFESDTIWHLEPCPRIIPETDERCGSCRTSLAAARRTDCNFSCRYFGPAAGVLAVVVLGVDQGPNQRVSHLSSGTVG